MKDFEEAMNVAQATIPDLEKVPEAKPIDHSIIPVISAEQLLLANRDAKLVDWQDFLDGMKGITG